MGTYFNFPNLLLRDFHSFRNNLMGAPFRQTEPTANIQRARKRTNCNEMSNTDYYKTQNWQAVTRAFPQRSVAGHSGKNVSKYRPLRFK